MPGAGAVHHIKHKHAPSADDKVRRSRVTWFHHGTLYRSATWGRTSVLNSRIPLCTDSSEMFPTFIMRLKIPFLSSALTLFICATTELRLPQKIDPASTN